MLARRRSTSSEVVAVLLVERLHLGVARVVEDAGRAADLVAVVVAARLVAVDRAVQPDEALLTVVGAPRVADDPVALVDVHVEAVADELHVVVDRLPLGVRDVVRVVVVEDAGLVVRPLVGADGDGERAVQGEGLHHGVAVVARDEGPRRHVRLREPRERERRAVWVVDHGELVRDVLARLRVLLLHLRREEVDVRVRPLLVEAAEVLHPLPAGDVRAAAAAVLGLRARGDLLGRQHGELAVADREERLNRLHGGVGPARAARALVLDARQDGRVRARAVVDGLREVARVRRRLVQVALQRRLAAELRARAVVAAELVLGPVGELVDAALPRHGGVLVVALDVGEAVVEDLLAHLPLVGALDVLPVGVLDVVVEGVAERLQLVPAREGAAGVDGGGRQDRGDHGGDHKHAHGERGEKRSLALQ
mmetsp:Transcript_38168/g.117911  ORF Transcript_38168/g.117911 Transcript_38168/m.117911 type:complete len:423 (-) Transcript_38168:18-1286(-)